MMMVGWWGGRDPPSWESPLGMKRHHRVMGVEVMVRVHAYHPCCSSCGGSRCCMVLLLLLHDEGGLVSGLIGGMVLWGRSSAPHQPPDSAPPGWSHPSTHEHGGRALGSGGGLLTGGSCS